MSSKIFKLLFSLLCLLLLVISETNEVFELQVYHRSSIIGRLTEKTLMYAPSDWGDDFPDYFDYGQYDGMHGKVISATKENHRGEYYARVIVGYPLLQEFFLTIDTGSDFTWLQCQPCVKCYEQIDPIFNKSKSTAYNALYCDDEFCKKAGRIAMCDAETNKCIYETGYGDGSVTKGAIVVDTLTFLHSNVSVYHFVHGCGYDNQGIFGYSAGILGLGPGNTSLPDQIKVDGFSYCLGLPTAENGSTLMFGSNLLLNLPSSISVPMIIVKEHPYYFVSVIGISVGGKRVALPQSTFLYNKHESTGVFVDSGAVLTLFPDKAFNVIVKEFATQMNWTRTTSISFYQACFIGLKDNTPNMTFHFPNGKSIEFSSDNFVFDIQPNTVCLMFHRSPSSVRNTTIIGSLLQRKMRLTFELSRSLLEFTPDQC